MRIKKPFNKVHLWLGLTSGLVVSVSMMAAAIFVWEEELTELYYHDYVFVTEATSVTLPVSKLLKVARSAAQEKTIYGVRTISRTLVYQADNPPVIPMVGKTRDLFHSKNKRKRLLNKQSLSVG